MATRRIASLSSRKVIYAAVAGNLLVAATKFGAAAWTGSSAMLSEGVHSVVDTGNSLLLLYGLNRAKRSPDHDHPLGYGREIYFWSFVVAVLVFALGAGVSFYEGVAHVLNPEPIRNPVVNYAGTRTISAVRWHHVVDCVAQFQGADEVFQPDWSDPQ
jgi:cation diffusion facilitator family transporter